MNGWVLSIPLPGKDETMVTAIQSGSPAPAPAPPPAEKPVEAAHEPAAATKATRPAEPKAVEPPKKADIKVDTEMMRKNLQEAISRINEIMRDGGRGLQFSVDDKLGGPVILVKKEESGEVIRQIPNEAVVRVAHSIEDLKGMLHNESV